MAMQKHHFSLAFKIIARLTFTIYTPHLELLILPDSHDNSPYIYFRIIPFTQNTSSSPPGHAICYNISLIIEYHIYDVIIIDFFITSRHI